MDYHIAKLLAFLCAISSVFCNLQDDKQQSRQWRSHKKVKHRSEHPEEHTDVKKYFQDIYVAQLVPNEKEFGHVFEDPLRWEERFEKIHLDNNRHQGKVKWGDDKGGYGEFYFDFDHGGSEEDISAEKEGSIDKTGGENKDPGYDDVDYNKSYGIGDGNHEYRGDSYKGYNKKEHNNIDGLHQRHLSDEIELLPGFKLDNKAPLHGGNYRKL